MSRAAASIFSEMHLRTGSLKGEVSEAKRIIGGLQTEVGKLSGPAQRFLIATGAAVGLAVREFANAERQASALRSALAANGYEVEGNAASFDKFAKSIAAVTTLDDDAVKGLGALALNLGATADNMQDVVQAGIGLGQRFFGGDFEQGVKAAALATQGQLTQLKRLIPALKQAKTEEEALAIINKAATAGFKQAKADTQTFAGSMIVLKNEVNDAAKVLGAAFAPEIQAAAAHVRQVAQAIKELTPEQRQMIVGWTKTAVEGAAATVAIDKIGRGVTGVLAIFRGLGAVAGAGAGLVGGIGVALAGLGALFTNLVGKGDTFAERFENVWERSSLALEKFEKKTIGSWDDLWNAVVYRFFQANSLMFGGSADELFKNYLDGLEADRKAATEQASRDASRRTTDEKKALDDQAKLHGNAVDEWKDKEKSKVTDALGVYRDIQAAILKGGAADVMKAAQGPAEQTPEQKAAEDAKRQAVVRENAAIQREQAAERYLQGLRQQEKRLAIPSTGGGEVSDDADALYANRAEQKRYERSLAKRKADRLQAQADRKKLEGNDAQARPGDPTPLNRDTLGDQIKKLRDRLKQIREDESKAGALGNQDDLKGLHDLELKYAGQLADMEAQFKLGKGQNLQETPDDRMNKDFGANVKAFGEALKGLPQQLKDAVVDGFRNAKVVGVLDE